MNRDDISGYLVIDCKRKAFCQHAMIVAEKKRMNTGINLQRINIREQGIDEVSTQPGFLFLVESGTVDQVL